MKIKVFDVETYHTLDIPDPEDRFACLLPYDTKPWPELLASRYRDTEPGIGQDKIYGFALIIHLEAINFKPIEINNLVCSFCGNVFDSGNVLSIRARHADGGFIYRILIFPLVKRVLQPTSWICKDAGTGKFYIKEEIEDCFYAAIQETFQCEPEKRKDFTRPGISARVDSIRGMAIPHPSEIDTQELIYDAKGFEKQTATDTSYEQFMKICNHTICYFTTGVERALYMNAQKGDITPDKFLAEVDKFLIRQFQYLTEGDRSLVLDKVYSTVYKNHILDTLIEADDISDIKVLDPSHIRVKCNGKRMTSNVTFLNAEDYIRYINSLAVRYGLDLAGEAFHRFTDTATSGKYILRCNITTQYVNSSPFPYLHIRKIRKDKYSLEDLVRMQCVPRHVAEYLRYQINNNSMVFCGKGGSGKTTLMNTLLDQISFTKSGLVIQESEELFSVKHPDFMFQHETKGHRGFGEYTLKDEAKNGLLTDLDYFIISEIKGGEALYFLNAAITGHKCVCSVHAPSSKDAIDKLADYVMYESSYTKEQAVYMLKELKILVYMENFKVKEISEIVGWDEEKKCLQFKLVYQL